MSNPRYLAYNSNSDRHVYHSEFTTADIMYHDEHVKSYYDNMLHETLCETFQELCLTSSQKKELLRKHEDKLKLILKQKPAFSLILHQKTELLMSLLWIAVWNIYQNSAELLVRSGADLNERCKSQSTPFAHKEWTILHVLLQMHPTSWNERFIALVTDHGADLTARDCDGQTVLHYAVNEGRVQATKLFLEKGAEVNVTDYKGETPLLAAARNSKADQLMPLLMKHGADVFAKHCRSHENALHYLACNHQAVDHATDLARVLIKKGVSLEDRNLWNQYQPIHEAAYNGKNELVKLFLDHGSNVNARAKHGEFPLYLAAESEDDNSTAVMRTLLERGANIDQKTIKHSRTALHSACEKQNKRNIQILLSVGADVFDNDYLGITTFDLFSMMPTRLMHEILALTDYMQPLMTDWKEKGIINEHDTERSSYCPWIYYENCVEQVDRMKITKIIETCTFFDLLTKCQCQIAALMRNPQFESKFWLYDLNVFYIYAEDILEAFNRAEYLYSSRLDQEEVINEAVGNSLPHLIVRKVARYIHHCDICKMKKIVHASRGSIDNSN